MKFFSSCISRYRILQNISVFSVRFSWAGGLPKTWVISCLIFSRSVSTISFDRGSGQLVRNLLLLSASKCCCLPCLEPQILIISLLPTPIVFLPVALLFYCNGNRLDIGWNNNDKIRGKQVWTFLVITVWLRVNYLQVSSNLLTSTVDIMIKDGQLKKKMASWKIL